MKVKKDAYIIAIENEIKSQNLYKLLVKSLANTELKKIFSMLIPIEEEHERKLRHLFSQEFSGEEPKISSSLFPKFGSNLNLSDPKDVFIFAKDRELEAKIKYLDMANTFPELTDLFNQLAKEEENHADLIYDEIEKLEGISIWFDRSELDGFMED